MYITDCLIIARHTDEQVSLLAYCHSLWKPAQKHQSKKCQVQPMTVKCVLCKMH